MKLDRQDMLKGLAATAIAVGAPSSTLTVHVRPWMPPVPPARDLAGWLEVAPLMEQGRWHYQQLADGTGVIRHMPSRMAFWTSPVPGSWWQKSACRLFAEGEALTQLRGQAPGWLQVARAAANIAGRVSFMREEGESLIACYAGSGPWP